VYFLFVNTNTSTLGSEQEKLYAYFISMGSWAGSLTCLVQTSPESPLLFHLLVRLFSADSLSELQGKSVTCSVSPEEWDQFLQFCSCFFGNMGNYLSFGDTKFIPRCSPSAVRSILGASSLGSSLVLEWDEISESIYDLSSKKRQMGIDGKGISTYYSSDISSEEIKVVQNFLVDQKQGDQVRRT
jgi:dipeptidyl-peptidase III